MVTIKSVFNFIFRNLDVLIYFAIPIIAYHISALSPIPSGFHVQSMLHMHSSRVNASTMLMIR